MKANNKDKPLSQKKRQRRAQICNKTKIGTKRKIKVPKQKIGYLFEYKAIPTQKDIDFAKFHNIKLTTHINIYSKSNDLKEVIKILSNRDNWSYDNELKYLKYEFVKSIPITNSKLLRIRQSTFWIIEKRELPEFINNENITVYTCFTNLHHLKYLSKKSDVKQWIFSDIKSSPDYLLKDIKHYNRLISKGRVIVDNPVVAKQCLNIRSIKGHKVEYITDKTLTLKAVTKPNKIRKPIQNKLVCITDDISVVRLPKYLADERIGLYSSLHYCTKSEYYKYLNEMRGIVKKKYKDTIKDRTPKLSVQGSKESINVETGKTTDKRTRRERRFSLQKKPMTSRQFKSQFVTGKWVLDEDGKHETFIETGEHKRITHGLRPTLYTKPWYNPLKRKTTIPYEEEEKIVKKIVISKFPYNKEIVVIYTEIDKDGVVHHPRKEHCKMLNKKIIQENSETGEQIVICSIKNVESWMHQEDYPKDINTNIDATKWIPYVSVTTDTKVIKHKPVFHLPKKQQKTKKWRHPIKQTWWERRGIAPF